MDWLFDHDNTKELVNLLALEADPTLLKQKSFKVFIEVLWSYYQPRILFKVFIPQLVYSAIFIYLSTYVFGSYFKDI